MFNLFKNKFKQQKGFTLLEVLLVIAMIAILAAIVIIAINPAKQLAESRNAQRRSDVNTILNAVYQYTIDNGGVLPTELPAIGVAVGEICWTPATADATCVANSFTNLSVLTDLEKYITAIPKDPSWAVGDIGVGYTILKTANDRITVAAPDAELLATISVTR